jgi:hypothetical protein
LPASLAATGPCDLAVANETEDSIF